MQPTASPSAPPTRWLAWRRWGREAGFVFVGGLDRLMSRFWIILAAIAIGAGLVFIASPLDNALLARCQLTDTPQVRQTARFLTQWGDLHFAVPLALLIWIAGVAGNRVRWRKLGVALIMAGLVSGLIITIFRSSLGRTRPDWHTVHPETPDRLYGPWYQRGEYESFPSGHACTSATTAGVLAASPLLAVPSAIYAVGVSWSRMQLNRHHPIDVTVGAFIGGLCGLCWASAVPGTWIKLRRRQKKRKA